VGEVLRVTPRELLTDETRNLILAHKPELVELLRGMAGTGNQVTVLPSTAPTDPQESSPGREAEDNPVPVPDADPQQWDEDAYQERAAIVEHEAGVPQAWAEGLAQLCAMDRPKDISPKRWEAIVDAAGVFVDHWAAKASSLGWDYRRSFLCLPRWSGGQVRKHGFDHGLGR
ncbi:MAG: hypothetical protein HQL73_13565, partial [Magnetococcales bacterium]|nr:hypothetical protein [Magnetococcales bacterium]